MLYSESKTGKVYGLNSSGRVQQPQRKRVTVLLSVHYH